METEADPIGEGLIEYSNKNSNKTIATITHEGAFVAIVVLISITTCILSDAYVCGANPFIQTFCYSIG